MPQRAMVVLSDSMLASMAGSTAITNEFPFLKSLNKVRIGRKCGSCGSSNKNVANAFQSAKQVLAGLSSDKKLRLKQLLDTKSVQILYRRSDNKLIDLRF